MNFESELNFFCDILEKCHIHASILSVSDSIGVTVAPKLKSAVGYFSGYDTTLRDVIGNVESKTKYMISNEFKL